MSSSSPFPAVDHDGSDDDLAPGRGLDQLGDIADRLGTSVASLVVGTVVALAAVGLAVVVVVGGESSAPELTIPYASPVVTATEVATTEQEAGDPTEIMVHAAGAVRHPGVYVVGEGARVADLLTAAGGPSPDADLDRVNLAAPVGDGTRLYVPRVGEEQLPEVVGGERGVGTATSEQSDPGRLLDLNQASAADLERLPGIGPATASAIVDHRERHGPFAQVDDLLQVRGIGEAKLAALRDLVHV